MGPRQRRAVIPAVMAAALAAACTAGTTSAPSSAPTASATATATTSANPALPAGVVLVKGTGRCEVTSRREEEVGNEYYYYEHFRCANTMSDPRLDGTFDADFTTTIEPSTAPTMRWEGTVSIVNAGGSWTGHGRGAVVMWSDTAGPTNYGVDTYEGHGAYAGLVYHELVAGSNERADLAGWIETKEPAAPSPSVP